jgi:archaea-specific DNA-binding protein
MEAKHNSSENVILIGSKPLMNYVTGVVVQFTTKNAKKVTIKSRGKFISKAVDVSEVSRRKFLDGQEIIIGDIRIGSEEFENKEKKKIHVSTLEIDLVKG